MLKAAAATTLFLLVAALFLFYKPIALIVLSGSMVPVIYPGDILIVIEKNPKEISVGDIITFKSPEGKENELVTHRVINISKDESGKLIFQTKGDAVEEPDKFVVHEKDIVGEPVLLIPMLGYLHENRKLVYFSMILVPSILIFLSELRVLKNPKVAERFEEIKKRKNDRLKLRKSVSWKRVVATISFMYLFFSLLLTQEVVPVQKISVEGGRVTLPADVDPYEVYYVLPPFYVEKLYEINPLLPTLAIVLYPLIVSFLLSPLWKTGGRSRRWKRRRLYSSFPL